MCSRLLHSGAKPVVGSRRGVDFAATDIGGIGHGAIGGSAASLIKLNLRPVQEVRGLGCGRGQGDAACVAYTRLRLVAIGADARSWSAEYLGPSNECVGVGDEQAKVLRFRLLGRLTS